MTTKELKLKLAAILTGIMDAEREGATPIENHVYLGAGCDLATWQALRGTLEDSGLMRVEGNVCRLTDKGRTLAVKLAGVLGHREAGLDPALREDWARAKRFAYPSEGALKSLAILTGRGQRAAMLEELRGEEGAFFAQKIEEICATWAAMPKTHETDGQGRAALAQLHYFIGCCDWWIVEKDADPDGEGQIQAFGVTELGRGCRELGYISLPEILAFGAELDLYWKPITVGEILDGATN